MKSEADKGRRSRHSCVVTADAERAVDELRKAILATRPSDEWFSEDRTIFDLAQACVARWADDLGRSLGRIGDALRQHSGAPDEEMTAVLEEALTQIGSVRDKIVATAAQILEGDDVRVRATGSRCRWRSRVECRRCA